MAYNTWQSTNSNCFLITAMCNFTGGAPPSDVTAEQTDLNTVLVMWTAPSPPPTNGYRVKLSGQSSVTVTGTSHIISVGQRGV